MAKYKPDYKVSKQTSKSEVVGLMLEAQACEVIPKQTSVKLKVLDAEEQTAEASLEKAKAAKILTQEQIQEMLENRKIRRQDQAREAKLKGFAYRDDLKQRYYDNWLKIKEMEPTHPFRQLLEQENEEIMAELSGQQSNLTQPE